MLLADDFEVLETVEFKGNALPRKVAKEYVEKFKAKNRELIFFEEEDEDEDLEDEEEEDEAEEGAEDIELIAKLEKLKL